MLSLSFLAHFAVGANLLGQIPLLNALAIHQHRATGSLDDFIAAEVPIVLQGVLDNIGSAGARVAGAASGLVVASPNKNDPDYFDTWTRDSALTFKALVDAFIAGNASLEPQIQNYIYAQAQLQAVPNLSGDLSTGAGLGEPKFEVDGTAFNAQWGRPQRDGPALRATALISYSRYLVTMQNPEYVTNVIWPIISNDLNYIGQYWNATGFDLWEETLGSSFFTTAVQHRALVEGLDLAYSIGQTCLSCISQAPQVLCFLQSYWNGEYIEGNINTADNGRSRRDGNTILGAIHTFDPTTTCDTTTFQPCSDNALANHKVLVDSFRNVFAIDGGIPEGQAVAIGRYPEDTYQGGNPWYLLTLAAAEQLYDALYTWTQLGSLEVSQTNLAFFQDFDGSVAIGRYANTTTEYNTLTTAIRNYADGFFSIVEKYTPANGSLAEQFNRNDGTPLSAADLTWSYAAFLTCVAARNGQMPASWKEQTGRDVPTSCVATSAQGTYTTPSATAPIPPCDTVTLVSLTFNVAEATALGENIFLAGSIQQLGNWNPSYAVPLSGNDYQVEYPRWYGTVQLSAGTAFQYKYIKVGTDGEITWEADPNRSYTVPEGCAPQVQVHDTWQS